MARFSTGFLPHCCRGDMLDLNSHTIQKYAAAPGEMSSSNVTRADTSSIKRTLPQETRLICFRDICDFAEPLKVVKMSLLIRQCERQWMAVRFIFHSIFGSGYLAPPHLRKEVCGCAIISWAGKRLRWPEFKRALSCGSGCAGTWPPEHLALGHH